MSSARIPGPLAPDGVSPSKRPIHHCLLYKNPEERLFGVTAFVRSGLECGEPVLCIVEGQAVQAMAQGLAAAGLDVSGSQAAGMLRFVRLEDVKPDGSPDPSLFVRSVREAVENIRAKVGRTPRVCCEMTCLPGQEDNDASHLTAYETQVGEWAERESIVLLCQYDRSRISEDVGLAVLHTHPSVLVGNRPCRNVYYVPPDESRAPTEDSGRLARWMRNLVSQEAAADSLRNSESFFRVAFDEASVGMAQVTPQGTIYRVNAKLADLLGYARSEMEGTHYEAYVHPDDLAVAGELMRFVDREYRPRSMQRYRLRHREGRAVWVSMSRALTRDSEGRPQFVVCQVVDITASILTEQKKAHAEKELATSRKRLQAAVDAGGVGIWDWDLRSGQIVWEGYHAGLFGPEDFDGTYASFRQKVHPEDIEDLEEAMDRARETGRGYESQYRVVWPDGSIHWVVGRGAYFYDGQGVAVTMSGTVTDITRIKEAEGYLQRNEELLRAVIESTGDGILVVSQENRVWHHNTRFKEMWGVSPSAGMDALGIREAAKESVARPEAFIRKSTEIVLSDRESSDLVEFKDGRIIECNSYPLKGTGAMTGRVWSYRDVTTRVRAEIALRESQERFRLLVENAPDAVFVQTESKFSYVNPACLRMLGAAEPEDLLSRPVEEAFHPDFRPGVRERIRRLNELREPVPVLRERLFRLDGSVVDAEVSAVPIHYLGKDGALVFMRDVTDLVRGEEERRELEVKIQQAQRLESLGVLAGGIAHDFNNLLTVMLGNAELALRNLPEPSPAFEHLEQVKVAARSAAGLTRQMLVYAGQGRMEVEAVELSSLVKEMGHLLEVSIGKRCALRYRFAKDLPRIGADPAQVRQVVMNLIINASEALDERDGDVTVSTGEAECDAAFFQGSYLGDSMPEGRYVYLTVSDTGCGMDAETLARIFEPFFTTKFAGRGLGLAAVLGIVKSHGGTLKVISEPGRGTSFTVYFPVSGAPAPAVPAAEGNGSWRGSGCVLVVDDEPGVRTVAKGILMSAGFTALPAKDGCEGIEIFREKADEICLVLLDMAMPRMDGEEAFHELKRIRPEVKVILCSGYTETDATTRFAGLDLAGFVQKPFDIPALLDAVRHALEG
ncbi:MAG: PAS domain S-box protein [FCB group bacterium]|jgi:PAS domain S-box-containing protein|nr:PAS domain S-box protein [FCB group bacterium]